MRRKKRAVAGNLAALKAETAHRFTGDELVSVPVATLKAGDRLLVKPGERVPADGTFSRQLRDRRKHCHGRDGAAQDWSGQHGLCRLHELLRCNHASGDGRRRTSLIDEIEKLLDRASSAKSRTVRLADRASRIYAPVVHSDRSIDAGRLADRRRLIHDALITAIAVLIITCPCALALAISAVQVVASGAAFPVRLILNTGDAIERLAEVDTIIFDKTGTLTLPEPRVVNATALDPGLLARGARLALSSRHPLAVALSREALHAHAIRRRD